LTPHTQKATNCTFANLQQWHHLRTIKQCRPGAAVYLLLASAAGETSLQILQALLNDRRLACKKRSNAIVKKDELSMSQLKRDSLAQILL
jgi:hypothetical protein